MKPIWQKIIAGVIIVFLAWFLTFFRFDSFTGSEGKELESRQEIRTKESEDRIIKKVDENDARQIKKIEDTEERILKAIEALREDLKEHTHKR